MKLKIKSVGSLVRKGFIVTMSIATILGTQSSLLFAKESESIVEVESKVRESIYNINEKDKTITGIYEETTVENFKRNFIEDYKVVVYQSNETNISINDGLIFEDMKVEIFEKEELIGTYIVKDMEASVRGMKRNARSAPTPHEFYLLTIGQAINADGAGGVQCVDLFKYFTQIYHGGIQIRADGTGYAKEYMNYINTNGLLNYFDSVPVNQLKDGDWVIWTNTKEAPYSHIAMFRKDEGGGRGLFLGQNQHGVSNATQGSLSYDGIIGVLRPKVFKENTTPVTPPLPIGQGHIDYIGNNQISGWAKDPYDTSYSKEVHVYITDKKGKQNFYGKTANESRKDVGGNYGFSFNENWGLGLTPGPVKIDVYMLGSQGNSLIESRNANWDGNYVGVTEALTGDFNGDGKDDVLEIEALQNSRTQFNVKILNSQGLGGNQTWFDSQEGGYISLAIYDRTVVGDFNGDGKDDVAAVYDYAYHGINQTKIHVFISDGSKFKSYESWYDSGVGYNYLADSVTGRVKAGDFNGDGKDDIATIYDYRPHGVEQTKIHVFKSEGNKFASFENWFDSGVGYNYLIKSISDRVTVGDFNGDGKDDIATIYDYRPHGVEQTKIHVFKSEGNKFASFENWYESTIGPHYLADSVTGRVEAGDFNGDGKDDIAAIYDYRRHGIEQTKIHVFKSEGSKFKSFENWYESEVGPHYLAMSVKNNMMVGNFNGDANADILTRYDYKYHAGMAGFKYHLFTSNKVKFNNWINL